MTSIPLYSGTVIRTGFNLVLPRCMAASHSATIRRITTEAQSARKQASSITPPVTGRIGIIAIFTKLRLCYTPIPVRRPARRTRSTGESTKCVPTSGYHTAPRKLTPAYCMRTVDKQSPASTIPRTRRTSLAVITSEIATAIRVHRTA